MVFSWMRDYQRREILETPFPAEWLAHLNNNVTYYSWLTEPEQERLRNDLRILVAEKTWEECGGLVVTDEIKVTIAAQACLMLLGVEHDYFSRVLSVLVYPTTYRHPWTLEVEDDWGEGSRVVLGEAWYRGPVVLAWDAVLAEGRAPEKGRNLVIHEFAHQLDFLDGLANGTPPLKDHEQAARWHGVFTAEFNKLIRDARKGRATILDQYGTANEAEFFAVATECFFTQPALMKRGHPLLYQVLRDYYGQDTAARMTRMGTTQASKGAQ